MFKHNNSISSIGSKSFRKISALLLALLVSLPALAGGPWTQPKGQGYFQFQTTVPVYKYSSLLMGTFIKETQGVNRKTFNSDFSFYLDYGLTDKLNLTRNTAFKVHKYR